MTGVDQYSLKLFGISKIKENNSCERLAVHFTKEVLRQHAPYGIAFDV